MSNYLHEQDREARLAQAVLAARSASDLAESRYAEGLLEFTGLVDTQHSQLSLEEQLVLSRANITLNRIRLYRALGGGWHVPASHRVKVQL